jgi:hypothetical protein
MTNPPRAGERAREEQYMEEEEQYMEELGSHSPAVPWFGGRG